MKAVEVNFQLFRKVDIFEMAASVAGPERNDHSAFVIVAIERAIRTMAAPFSGAHFCACCGHEFPKKEMAEAFILGETADSYLTRPVCADCAKLGTAEIMARFADSFQAEYPSAERVTSPGRG